MRHRLSLVTVAVLLVLLVGVPAAAAASPALARVAPKVAPKVVLIVGPVSGVTDEYRALADEAAAAASEFTPNVVKVYSPDATWPVVRNALQGASLVVYLGHGNGWPSPYRNSLYPASQNGFGLNPVAGAGDDAHQYFGEDRIATEVQLAPNAIVILSRLCYASGNSEPGLAEGTIAVAEQRVDNYAAGFIAAGAGAVIAEAHAGPAWYVRQVLSGRGSVERMWNAAPTANGHVTRFDSVRSPGYIGRLDPDAQASGFYRSIVLRSGLALGAGRGRRALVVPRATEPTLVDTGLILGTPDLIGRSTIGAHVRLKLHYAVNAGAVVPEGMRIGVRWDPLDVPGLPAEAGPDSSGIDLVAAERLGSIVAPVKAQVGKSTLSIPVTMPGLRGQYRLVVTLHDAKGDAYNTASQQLVRQVVVRVTGSVDGGIAVRPEFTSVASSPVRVQVGVTNLGVAAWGRQSPIGRRLRPGEGPESALLVTRWIPLDPSEPLGAWGDEVLVLPPGLEPGASADLGLSWTAPPTAGQYLLVLDVVTPADGSLAALGIGPTLVRVSVTEPLH